MDKTHLAFCSLKDTNMLLHLVVDRYISTFKCILPIWWLNGYKCKSLTSIVTPWVLLRIRWWQRRRNHFKVSTLQKLSTRSLFHISLSATIHERYRVMPFWASNQKLKFSRQHGFHCVSVCMPEHATDSIFWWVPMICLTYPCTLKQSLNIFLLSHRHNLWKFLQMAVSDLFCVYSHGEETLQTHPQVFYTGITPSLYYSSGIAHTCKQCKHTHLYFRLTKFDRS